MFRHIKTTALSALALVVCSVASTPSALAYDRKGYHGSECNAYYASTTERFDHRIDGLYNNSGTSGGWVMCPITRDNSFDNAGPGSTTWVRVYDSSATTQSLSCYLHSLSQSGGIIRSDSESFSGNNSYRWMSLNLPTTAGTSQSWAGYGMYCWLPPRSRIVYYNVYERTPTDANN